MEKPQIIEHINKSLNYTIFDAKWVCLFLLLNFINLTKVMISPPLR